MKVVQTFMQTGGERENDTAQQGASHHADLVVGVAVQQQSESGAGREDQEPLEPTARLTAQQVVEHTYRIQKRHQQTIRSNQREQEKILRNPGLAFGDNSGTIDKHWALLKPRTVFASSQPAFQSNQVEREIETGFQNGDETRIQRAGIFDLTFCDYEKATERYSTKLGSGGEGDIYHGNYLIYVLFYPFKISVIVFWKQILVFHLFASTLMEQTSKTCGWLLSRFKFRIII